MDSYEGRENGVCVVCGVKQAIRGEVKIYPNARCVAIKGAYIGVPSIIMVHAERIKCTVDVPASQ